MKKTIKCGNPDCSRVKPTKFVARLMSSDEGVERENRWYCSERCYVAVVMHDYFRRKNTGREVRSSTHPVTERSFGAELMRMGRIGWMELEEAIAAKNHNGGMPVAHYLIQRGLITRRDVIEALGRHHHVPVAKIGETQLGRELVNKIPAPLARIGGVVPLSYDSKRKTISLVMKDPSDLTTTLTVKRLLNCDVKTFQGDPAEIERILCQHYSETSDHTLGAEPPLREQVAVAN